MYDRNIPFCTRLAKLRLSDHKLEIEVGRYNNTIRAQRICRLCKTGVEDVAHFLMLCDKTKEERILFHNEICEFNAQFLHLNNDDKLKYQRRIIDWSLPCLYQSVLKHAKPL